MIVRGVGGVPDLFFGLESFVVVVGVCGWWIFQDINILKGGAARVLEVEDGVGTTLLGVVTFPRC
jgi:hypothetical protein